MPDSITSDGSDLSRVAATPPPGRVSGGPAGGRLARIDRAAGGLAVDLGLYAVSAAFALVTALTATLPPHGAWGAIAWWGYLGATLAVLGQLIGRRYAPWLGGPAARWAVTGAAWAAGTLLPLVMEAAARAGGRTDRAQEEVVVVENGGYRLLHTGTPYLSHHAIAALAPDERLFGYLPYQPGMALLGLPRALATTWFTDARVWFALVTAVCLVLAARRTRRASAELIRPIQAATVLPLCALTLAVGGDDLPVLGLCLLALAYAAAERHGAAGIAVGVAGALKLFAWPVALVLFVLALHRGRGGRYAWGAFGLPALSLVPAVLVDPGAVVENVVRFPLGQGLVRSPAESPFPGHLIAVAVPGGHVITSLLLVLAGAAMAWWLYRRPPHDAGGAALVCAAGLLAATLLMPSTRFGYLLYPVAYAVWAPVLFRRPGTGGEPAPSG